MKILRVAALIAAGLVSPQAAFAGEAEYAEMVAAHARANGVPEALVHRVIMRESRYQPGLVGHGGTIGLMQIKLATARGVGYTGDAAGLRDPNTNLTYAVSCKAAAPGNGATDGARGQQRGLAGAERQPAADVRHHAAQKARPARPQRAGAGSTLTAVIPGQSAGLNPESRDSGLDASHRPGMTALWLTR